LAIYLIAPFVGAGLAVFAHRLLKKRAGLTMCAKVYHALDVRCIFCGHRPDKASAPAVE
jgi:hypothetical protein